MADDTTIEYYETHMDELIQRYDNADMSSLHTLLLKILRPKSKVLDIGFGSGRDLQVLFDHGYDAWGIDPSVHFVNNAKKRFLGSEEKFFIDGFPLSQETIHLENSFDAVICIAVWMHLDYNQYKRAVDDILKMCKKDAIVVISYSKGERQTKDERRFVGVDENKLEMIFKEVGYRVLRREEANDSLKRDSLTWHTMVLCSD